MSCLGAIVQLQCLETHNSLCRKLLKPCYGNLASVSICRHGEACKGRTVEMFVSWLGAMGLSPITASAGNA